MKIATDEEIALQEAERLEDALEFTYLPLDRIVVKEQIRQETNTNTESFTGLMESIKAKGVLEPVLVARQQDDTFNLLVGERRFKACRMLGLATIPARIVKQADTKADVITLQLIENLEREDLNPIDEANAYLEFLRTKIGAIDATGIINLITTYLRDPSRVEKAFGDNFDVISKITGKSTRSTANLFSLLTLPTPFQIAVRDGQIGISQGYIFAANLNNPQLYQILDAILKKPVTNEELKKLLDKAASGSQVTPRAPFTGFYSNIKTVRTAFEKGKAAYTQQDMEKLVAELDAFSALLKGEIEKKAAEAAEQQPAKALKASSGTGKKAVVGEVAATKKEAKKKTTK